MVYLRKDFRGDNTQDIANGARNNSEVREHDSHWYKSYSEQRKEEQYLNEMTMCHTKGQALELTRTVVPNLCSEDHKQSWEHYQVIGKVLSTE